MQELTLRSKVGNSCGEKRAALTFAIFVGLSLAFVLAGCASQRTAKHYEKYFNAAQAAAYSQASWPAPRGDSSNSGFVPIVTRSNLRPAWHVLEGASIWVSPAVSSKGNVYVTTGQGVGTSHLHAFDAQGNLLWESEPQRTLNDLDSAALFSAPVIDEAGDLYLGDSNQLWAFHPDGTVKWVADMRAQGIDGPLLSAVLVRGWIGGVSIGGEVAFFDRKKGRLALPILELPGKGGELGAPIPDGLLEEGLIDPGLREMAWELFQGARYEVVGSPAVHPKTGRMFVIGTGQTPGIGVLYAIELGKEQIEVEFQTPFRGGPGTNPVISPDGALVVSVGGDGDIRAFVADSGRLLWRTRTGGFTAVPAMGPDGTLYLAAGSKIVALDGSTGAIRWQRNYDDLARDWLPEIPATPGLVINGLPVAFPDSVLSLSVNHLWGSLSFGYALRLLGGQIVHPVRSVLVAFRPEDGSVEWVGRIPDSSEGGVSLAADGSIYVNLLAAQTSLAGSRGYDRLLPEELRIAKPKAGLWAFTPQSYRDLCLAGFDRIGGLLAEADEGLQSELSTETKRALESALSQVSSSRTILQQALDGAEISESQAKRTAEVLDDLKAEVISCINGILRGKRNLRASRCSILATRDGLLARAKLALSEVQ